MMFSQRVGFFPPAATVSPFVGSEITTTTNILYPFTQYSTSSMAYVGPDPSNRPLFAFVFVEPGTGVLKGQVIRINNDGTIFQGTTTTLDAGAGGGAHTVAVTSIYQGAGSFTFPTYSAGNTNTVVFYSYIKASTLKLMAGFGVVSRDQAGIPLSALRNPVSIFPTLNADGDQPVASYLGQRPNNPVPNANSAEYGILFGLRTGTGSVTQRFMTTGAPSSALTTQGPIIGQGNGPIDAAGLGFAGDFSVSRVPVFRSGYWNTGGGAQGTAAAVMSSQYSNSGVPAAANYQTLISTSPSVLNNSVYNQACNLNNSNKFLGVSFLSPANSLNLTVVDVSWNTPPSYPTTTVGAFVSAGSAGNLPAVVPGFVADTALLVQSPAGSTSLTYADITVAGTVPTVGSTQTLFGGLSNCQGPPILATGKIGTKTYLAGIQARSGSNTPYVFGVRFT
jgi:hypothetical protein